MRATRCVLKMCLAAGRGFELCPRQSSPKGCQPGQQSSAAAEGGIALPQQRLPQPGQQALCGPLL